MGKIVLLTALAIAAVVSGGCAEEQRRSDLSHTRTPHIASQKHAAEEALTLRREADSLREIASRREREAELLARNPGDEELVREKRELSQKLWHEADEVEEQAIAIGRDVPHNMVQ